MNPNEMMSDSDSDHTVEPDNNFTPPSIVRTLSQTLNTGVKEKSIISSKKKGDCTQAAAIAKTPATPLLKGLMKTKSCKTSVEMAQMIVPLTSEQFMMTAEVTAEFLVQIFA